MVSFTTILTKFASQGEKTGWTIICVSAEQANQLQPNTKKSFRVKGKLDDYVFEGAALIPMGEGNFILALNAAIRKKIRKQKGAPVKVLMEVDHSPLKLNAELLECLADEPEGLSFFNSLVCKV